MNRFFSLMQILAIVVFSLLMIPELWAQDAPARGYQSRPCGFDMNRNGILGEPDDCRVCDGSTRDPDSDGILEDMLYIDCDAGSDTVTCGSPGAPCKTIQYAWNTRADGPFDGAEDILCFRGTCLTEENTTSGVDGVEGYYVRPASGSEDNDWQYPLNPTMLVGWDSDADSEYPPYDTDDVAVLDGGPNRLERAFHISDNGPKNYMEMAHFTARDYGRYAFDTTDTGFMRVGRIGPVSSHGYLHDLQLERINRGKPSSSSTIVFNLFRGGTIPRWWAFENLNVPEMASWFARGSAQEDAARENGPYRFKNVTVTAHGCSQAACGSVAATTMFKFWGWVSRIEIIDSIFDLRPAAWGAGGNPSNGVSPAQCSRDWTIRNNEFHDFQRALNIQVTAENACDAINGRTVDEVLFDRNIWINTYPWGSGDTGVKIERGHSLKETAEDLRITNNVFLSTDPLASCFWSDAGNPNGTNVGRIEFIGNSCIADIDRWAAILIGNPNGTKPINFSYQQNYTFQNNIFTGISSGELNILSETDLTGLISDNNIFDSDADYHWNGTDLSTLREWRLFSKNDENSRDCLPTFMSETDFHLAYTDTCAVDRGMALDPGSRDVDGEARGLGGGWEIGADEQDPPIFFFDFEAGSTAGWSITVP